MTARGSPFYSQEVYDRFLELYPKMDTLDCIAQLAKEFSAVQRNCKPRPYWNKLALRHGLRKKEMHSKEIVVNNPSVEEIVVNNPSVELPDAVTFGGKKFPIAAIREFRARLQRGFSVQGAMTDVRLALPAASEIDGMAMVNFFKLRLFLSGKSDITAISDADFEVRLREQLRNSIICSLYEKKWRESAIVEKTVEMFPDLAAPSIEAIKHLVAHRRTKVKYAKRGRPRKTDTEDSPEKPRETKSNTYFVQLSGPKIQYKEELTELAAKSLLKTLLNIN